MEAVGTLHAVDTAIDTLQVLDPAAVDTLLDLVAAVVARLLEESDDSQMPGRD